jgi:hypothetical protein
VLKALDHGVIFRLYERFQQDGAIHLNDEVSQVLRKQNELLEQKERKLKVATWSLYLLGVIALCAFSFIRQAFFR